MTNLDTLHCDLRRLIDAIEMLLEQGTSPIAAPIEQMLADLHAIQGSLGACAKAMYDTAQAVQELANRPDPSDEVARLHGRLDALNVPRE